MSEVTSEVPTEIPVTPEKKLISRRRFLGLIGGAAVAAGLAYAGSRFELGASEKKTQFTPSEDEITQGAIATYGFQKEPIQAMMKKEGLPDQHYGLLAANSVTIIPVIHRNNEKEHLLGSGGIVEHKGRYYLTTAMHVMEDWIKNKDSELHFSVPGLSTPYVCKPTQLYTFNPYPEIEKDEPIFIELNDPTIRGEITDLAQKGELTPLVPRTYFPEQDTSLFFLRFQGKNPTLQTISIAGEDELNNVRRFQAYIDSGDALSCGGTSGTPLLRSENGKPTNMFLGVLTHGLGEEKDDAAGILGACSTGIQFGSFQEAWYKSNRLHSRKTWAS